jgi:putative oxidoreductase
MSDEMEKIYSGLAEWSPYILSLLRIITGFLFLQHGTQKLFAYPMAPPGGSPPLASLYGVAGIFEFVGGVLILLGLFTRPVAFLLSGQMAFAYFTVHAPQGFWPTKNEGEVAVFYCFAFLYFVFVGGGPLSLDALLLGHIAG